MLGVGSATAPRRSAGPLAPRAARTHASSAPRLGSSLIPGRSGRQPLQHRAAGRAGAGGVPRRPAPPVGEDRPRHRPVRLDGRQRPALDVGATAHLALSCHESNSRRGVDGRSATTGRHGVDDVPDAELGASPRRRAVAVRTSRCGLRRPRSSTTTCGVAARRAHLGPRSRRRRRGRAQGGSTSVSACTLAHPRVRLRASGDRRVGGHVGAMAVEPPSCQRPGRSPPRGLSSLGGPGRRTGRRHRHHRMEAVERARALGPGDVVDGCRPRGRMSGSRPGRRAWAGGVRRRVGRGGCPSAGAVLRRGHAVSRAVQRPAEPAARAAAEAERVKETGDHRPAPRRSRLVAPALPDRALRPERARAHDAADR